MLLHLLVIYLEEFGFCLFVFCVFIVVVVKEGCHFKENYQSRNTSFLTSPDTLGL